MASPVTFFLSTALASLSAVCLAGETFDTLEPAAIGDYGNFYQFEGSIAGEPGDLIRAQEVTPLAPGSRAWRVLYQSTSAAGQPAVVSGLVASPGKGNEQQRDIVSWAHGTKGVNDACAPSRGFRISHNFFDIAPEILAEGWIAVATDYEGLGTTDVHPYLVAASEAYGQMDIVRAARQIPGLSASKRYVGWGRSQGGHATLALGEEADRYAPELELLGIISAAPVGDMPTVFVGSAVRGASFNWLAAAGLQAAWGLDLAKYYEQSALTELNALLADNTGCYAEFSQAIEARGGVGMRIDLLLGLFDEVPHLYHLLKRSNVGDDPIAVPVLVSQGTDDKIVPKYLTDRLVGLMCELGTQVEYMENQGESHNDSTFLHMDRFRVWTRQRFEGRPASGCQTGADAPAH